MQFHNDSDLVEFARFFRDHSGINGETCLLNYDQNVANYQVTILESEGVDESYRQWMYQRCTQFGWFHTSRSEYQPFGHRLPADYYTKYCADIFGSYLTNATIHDMVDRTNVMFGGWNSQVTNVYFVNGWVDPWRMVGIQEDLNPSSPADVVYGASHCMDLYETSPRDSEEMLEVKQRVVDLIRIWLG